MPVTVIVRRQARPGHADALLAHAQARLRITAQRRDRRIEAWVFQSRTDPHVLLWVSRWESLAAYWTRMQTVGRLEPLDTLCVAPAERYFCRQVALYEDFAHAPAAVNCVVVHTPPEASEATLRYLQEDSGPAHRRLPGLTLRGLYEHHNTPTCFVIIQGWESMARFEDYERAVHPGLQARGQALGARIEHFLGVPRAYVDRYGPWADQGPGSPLLTPAARLDRV